MSWSLNASGHVPTPEGAENSAEVERELHDELRAVLSKPKYGAANSIFAGNHVQGEPHKPRAAHGATADDEDADGTETSVGAHES
jgi:hypothetical protein